METDHGRMIGQDFFDLRARIGSALCSLAKLAPEAGADPDHAAMLENLVNTLKDPFVFVVVGEVNVGKSTFLNALFAADITKTGVVPTTDKILFFKHGPVLRHVPITRTLEEVFVPVDFLHDFHIVDTPGTNSIENEHQEITERFVPMADLVIFVFSAMNPWGASAWQFLDKVHRHWMRHVVFVLQQCDLRTEEEVAAIMQYMRQLCRQRFDREFPIFPVSAKKAYLARSSGLDRERLLAESGFTPLEAHISRTIGTSGQRLGKLSTALRTAGGVLAVVAERSGVRIAAREHKVRALGEIQFELTQAEDRTNVKLAVAVDATEADFKRESGAILSQLQDMLTTRSAVMSVLKEKRGVHGLEQHLFDRMRDSSLERWAGAATIIEDDVCATADHLADRMAEDLKVQMRAELRPDPEFWEAQRRRFVTRTEEMLGDCTRRLGVEHALLPAIARTRRGASFLLILAMATLVGAGLLAQRQEWTIAAGVLGAGVVVCLLLWLSCGRTLGSARQEAARRFSAAVPELREQLAAQLREEVQNLYDAFSRVLQPTREKLAEQEVRHSSLQGQLIAMANAFQHMERELAGMTPPATH